MPISSRLTALAGGGISAAQFAVNGLEVTTVIANASSEIRFAEQIRVGVRRCITDLAEQLAGYRFLGTDPIRVTDANIGTFRYNININEREAGLRFNF